MNLFQPLVLLIVTASVRANEDTTKQKSGSNHESYLHGSSFAVGELDLEFYGNDVKPGDKVISEDEDNAEFLQFIHNIFETSEKAKYIENLEGVLFDAMTSPDGDLDQRDLIVNLPSIHCNCSSQNYFFNIEIVITPRSDDRLEWCDSSRQKRLGNHINAMLLDLGVGNAGVEDTVVFVARVCNVPGISRRRFLDAPDEEAKDMMEEEEIDAQRELATVRLGGFVYAGGGPCTGCYHDNHDRRKLPVSISSSCSGSSCSLTSTSTSCVGSDCNSTNSFCTSSGTDTCGCDLDFWGFLTDLIEKIKQYMQSTVVPNNWICCGSTPEISVNITAAGSKNDVDYGC